MDTVCYGTALDAPILADLNQEMIDASGHDTDLDRYALEERMRLWLLNCEYECVLFHRSEELIGYALFKGNTEIHLRQFLIGEAYRCRGIGHSAFRFLIKEVWSQAREVQLDVFPSNAVALSFWRKVGFTGKPEAMRLTIDAKFRSNTGQSFHWSDKAV